MFDEKDVLLAKGLRRVLEDGTFPLKAKEVQAFISVYNFAIGLDKRIEQGLEKKPVKRGAKK